MKINNISKHKYILPYFIILFLIVFPLFKGGYIFLTDYTSGPLLDLGSGLWSFLHKFLAFIFKNDVVQKIVIVLSYISVLFGGKKIVENFIDNKYLVFVVSLFALFNPYVYERTGYGQFGIIFAYGFLLFVFGFIIKFILNYKKENKLKENISIIYAAIFSGLAVSFAPHSVFFIMVPWLMVLIFFIKRFKEINKKQFFSYVGITALLVVVLNYNIILGIFSKDSTTTAGFTKTGISHQDLLAFATSDASAVCIDRFDGDCVYSSFARINTDEDGVEKMTFNKKNKGFGAFYNILSMSGFWGKDQFRFHDLTDDRFIFNFSFLAVFVLAIYGLVKSEEYFKVRKLSYIHKFLLGAFIVVVILAVGVRSEIFRWLAFFLFDNIPFYSGLREPQKWVSVLSAIYLIFITLAVKYIYEDYKVKNDKNKKILIGVLLGIIFILRAPYTLFGFSGQIVSIKYPEDWYKIDKILWENENKCNGGKVLSLPWHLYMHFGFMGQIEFEGEALGYRIVANPAPIFFRCPVVYGTNMEWGGIYDNVYSIEDVAVQKWFKSNLEDVENIKDIGIKYLLLAKEVDYEQFVPILSVAKYAELVTETPNFYLWKIK